MTTYVWPTLSNRSVAELEIGLKANTQLFTSELSGDIQTLELPGTRWTFSFRVANILRADGALLEAFIAKLRGMANRAQLPVFGRESPQGDWLGSGAVNNEAGSPTIAQTGASLVCNGFTAGATVKAGDYFNLGANGQLLMVTEDGTADGSGNLTISVQPNIRVAPAHGTVLQYTDPFLPLAILASAHQKWQMSAGDINNYPFDFVEVFA